MLLISSFGNGSSYHYLSWRRLRIYITRTPVTVYIAQHATFSTEPSTAVQNICLNGTATALTVAAAPTQSYQWYSNTTSSNSGGTLISGATNTTYTPLTTTAGTFYYYCVAVDSGCGTPSAVSGAVIIYPSTITITVHGNTAICQGDSVLLSVHYYPGSTYQWQFNGSNIGVNDTSIYAHQAGMYSISTTNSYGCIATGSVTTTINPLPPTPVITLYSTYCRQMRQPATNGIFQPMELHSIS